jgi:hypothetical protein
LGCPVCQHVPLHNARSDEVGASNGSRLGQTTTYQICRCTGTGAPDAEKRRCRLNNCAQSVIRSERFTRRIHTSIFALAKESPCSRRHKAMLQTKHQSGSESPPRDEPNIGGSPSWREILRDRRLSYSHMELCLQRDVMSTRMGESRSSCLDLECIFSTEFGACPLEQRLPTPRLVCAQPADCTAVQNIRYVLRPSSLRAQDTPPSHYHRGRGNSKQQVCTVFHS